MKIAILGGSFNPIHIGHLALADDVCVTLGYDKILFVPALNPPHKEMNDAASAQDRLAMVRDACKGDSRFAAEDCEIVRGGVSYTYDTVCCLEQKYRGQLDGKIGLIIGSDLTAEFHLWHNAAELANKCDLILARRPAVSGEGSFSNKPIGAYGMHPVAACESEPLFAHARTIENPLLSISSTDIRGRIAQGKSFAYLVPSAVLKYIRTGKLYGYR